MPCPLETHVRIAPNVDPTRDSTLGDWGPRAERLDRSLDAYTPVPSTPSLILAEPSVFFAVWLAFRVTPSG